MKMSEKIKNAIRNYLEINDPQGISINIDQLLDHEAEVFKNILWYRGESNELEAFYKSIDPKSGTNHFWSAAPTKGSKIRKIHTGLPGLIVDTLTDVCTDDLQKIELSERQDEWDAIAKENSFEDLVEKCVSDVLVTGDGAFKLSYDPEISDYPIIEFFPADRVETEYERGRLCCVVFKTQKFINGKSYILKEHYRKESITYSLESKTGERADMTSFAEFEKYKPIENRRGFIPAVFVRFKKSKKYEGRGKSIFSGKYDDFDSFDEVFSQWMLALRKGQIKTYIPEALLPRGTDGEYLGANDFDNDYISIENDMSEGASRKIETTQGTIQHEALLATYCTALDLCLQGIISPSTLGIDVKKLDNAEAQREKEKTTLYTRNKVINVLIKVLPELVEKTLLFYDCLRGTDFDEDLIVNVSFGGYANPSFEAQVETVGKAASQYSIMSIETSVNELYGDDKDEEWKKQEIFRIKQERGIAEMPEPELSLYGE